MYGPIQSQILINNNVKNDALTKNLSISKVNIIKTTWRYCNNTNSDTIIGFFIRLCQFVMMNLKYYFYFSVYPSFRGPYLFPYAYPENTSKFAYLMDWCQADMRVSSPLGRGWYVPEQECFLVTR